MKNVIALLVGFGLLFFAYRSCTKGYDQYAYFVQVSDERIFASKLKPDDGRIMDRGRRLKSEVVAMDQEIDGGDGAGAGKLRWYGCRGIDCDEGWEISFSVQ